MEAADHGQAAVDRLRQVCSTSVLSASELDKPFDVVLMDCEMPGQPSPPRMQTLITNLSYTSFPVMDGLTAVSLVRQVGLDMLMISRQSPLTSLSLFARVNSTRS